MENSKKWWVLPLFLTLGIIIVVAALFVAIFFLTNKQFNFINNDKKIFSVALISIMVATFFLLIVWMLITNVDHVQNVSAQKEIEQERAVLQLVNRHFWKSKIGPLSAFTIPLFLMIIYRTLSKGDISIFVSGLPAYFSFSILPLCFISLPQMIVEFKSSIILRKISNSSITRFKFIFLILSYNFIAVLFATLIIVSLYIAFLAEDAIDVLKKIKWGELTYSLFNVFISSLSIGLLLGVLINRINMIQITGFCLIIISITFSGQFIPIQVLYRSSAIGYASLASPISYSLNQMNVALLPNHQKDIQLLWNAGNILGDKQDLVEKMKVVNSYVNNGIFDIKNSFKIFDYSVSFQNVDVNGEIKRLPFLTKISITEIYKPWRTILNLVMPYAISVLAITTSLLKFKWTSR